MPKKIRLPTKDNVSLVSPWEKPQIDITIDTRGDITIETAGSKGNQCDLLAGALKSSLGSVCSRVNNKTDDQS